MNLSGFVSMPEVRVSIYVLQDGDFVETGSIHFIRVVYSDFDNLIEQLSELASLCGLNHEFRLIVPETVGAGFRSVHLDYEAFEHRVRISPYYVLVEIIVRRTSFRSYRKVGNVRG